MSHPVPLLGVQDALDDIDMELLRDAVQHDELGQSVQNVFRFQNDFRKETLDTAGKPDYRAIATRQFQLNDMLLTLLQELATRQRALELELGTRHRSNTSTADAPVLGFATGDDERVRPAGEDLVRRLDAIQAVMHDDALALQLEVTPNDTPVVGRLLGNMRAAVHSLAVFYGNQLAAKQTEINRVYGDALQQLLLEREHDRAQTTAQLHTLAAEFSTQLAALRAELAARDSGGETTAP